MVVIGVLSRFLSMQPMKKKVALLGGFAACAYAINRLTDPGYWEKADAGGEMEEAREAEEDCREDEDEVVQKRPSLTCEQFFRQTWKVVRVVVPGTREIYVIWLHACFLVSRTAISILVSKLDGCLVRSIIDQDSAKFAYYLVWWIGISIPAVFVDSMIRFGEKTMSQTFRTRLTEYSYNLYIKSRAYYLISHHNVVLSPGEDVEKCLIEDIAQFCKALARLYSNVTRPVLDAMLISYQLINMANYSLRSTNAIFSMGLSILVVHLTARVLRLTRPPFRLLAATRQKLEQDLRETHRRLSNFSEEVTFCRAETVELASLRSCYRRLAEYLNSICQSRIVYNMIEEFFIKYIWSACGLVLIALAIFFRSEGTASTRTRDYVTSRQLLICGADAVEKLILVPKEVNDLAERMQSVCQMLQTFENCTREKGLSISSKPPPSSLAAQKTLSPYGAHPDAIKFEGVSIVSPNELLVEKLTFEIRPGMHLCVVGPSGCGKTSIFRALCGLWPTHRGRIYRPASPNKILYLGQRPYLTSGTLYDQIVYPLRQSPSPGNAPPANDIRHLDQILQWVNLQYLVLREGGWLQEKNWNDVLSKGEKQRIALARMFYQRPIYAIFDACTSSVSPEVEQKIYQRTLDLGITLITVLTHPPLKKFHQFVLQFDGNKRASFRKLDPERVCA